MRALGASASRPSPPPEMSLLPPISRVGVPGTGHEAQTGKQSKTAPILGQGREVSHGHRVRREST